MISAQLRTSALAIMTLFAVTGSVTGDEFWDPAYRAGQPLESLEHHESRLIEGETQEIDGLSPSDARAVWQELRLRFVIQRVREIGDHPRGARILRSFLDQDLPPLLRALARSELGEFQRRSGDHAGASKTWGELGFLEDWWLVGPLDNERGSGFSRAYSPEEAVDLEAPLNGKRQSVEWRRWAEVTGNDDRQRTLDLAQLLQPNEESLAYLMTHLEATTPTEVAFRGGSTGAYALWLNGEEIQRVDVERPFALDQDVVVVRLSSGWNRLLVKTTTTKGPWHFRLRATLPDGSALTDVRSAADLPAGASVASAVGQRTQGSVSVGATSLLEGAKLSPTVLRLKGWLLGERHVHDFNEHPDRELFLAALEAEPESALTRYLLGRTYVRDITHTAEREENTWRQNLEQALAVDPDFHRARADLARYYLNRFGNVTRAETLLAPVLAAGVRTSVTLGLAARIREQRIGAEAATALLDEQRTHLDRELLTSLRLGETREAIRTGDHARAEELLVQGLALNATSVGLRQELKALRLLQGDEPGAEEQLTALLAAYPQQPWAHLRVAEYHADREDWNNALAAIDRAILIAPDHEQYHKRRGDVLSHLGRMEPALEEFSISLKLEPNQPKLREYVELLQKATSVLEDEYRLAPEGIISAAFEQTAESNDPARLLLDNVVVHIHQDGTTTRFHQHLAKITNDSGIQQYNYYSIPYAYGEQYVKVLTARVHHSDGTTEDARIRNRDPVKRAGEYPVWSSAWVDLPPVDVGDVVEIEYRQEDLRQSFFGDYFGDQMTFAGPIPRDRTVYTIVAPPEKELFFHQLDLDVQPLTTRDETSRSWRWDVGARDKVDFEPAQTPLIEVLPRVEVSTFQDWDAFATWYWHLIRKQFESSPDIKAKVAELTASLDTDMDKIRAIYNFVVTDVRYIAWEFGVHGFKPYNASTIFTRRFGDCKDKATLICTMLDEVGIDAYPVLIKGTRNREQEDFALPLVNHFNHCIAYVPDVGDGTDLFLDGTAEHHNVRQLPSMDRGAKVVVVKDHGSEVAQVPWNTPAEQAIKEKLRVKVRKDGSATVEQENQFAGEFAVGMRYRYEIEAQRATELERLFGQRFPGTQVEEVTMSPLDDLDAPVWMRVKLEVPDYLDISGEDLKLPPLRDFFGSTQFLRGLASRSERSLDLNLGNPQSSELILEIELPEGYRAAELESLVLEDAHAKFEFHAESKGNRLTLRRTLEITRPRVAAGDYAGFKAFADRVEQFREERILLEKIEEVE